MKEKTKKRIQGSISVLLVIILLPMMTFSAIIVDVSRVNMARQMMSSAGDLAMNTALANYDTILKDVYGLFAMSQADGMTNEKLGEELNKYFAKTLTSYGVVSEEEADDYVGALIGDFRELLNDVPEDTTNFLELSNIDFKAEKVEASSLANTGVLRKQIVEYMKYRAPLGLGLSFLDSLTSFEKMDDQNEVVEAQVAAQESTQDVTKACQKLIKLIRKYDKRVVEINKALKGVTGSANTDIIPLEDYDSHVMKYRSAWNENYKHINEFVLVFLANVPSINDVYLKALSYMSGQIYVNTSGVVYSGTNTGFTVTVDLATDKAGAVNQINGQITNLNNNYKPYTGKYATPILTPMNSDTISSEKEADAIRQFIAFEKFLLDQTDGGAINYSQVKAVLEQIAILDKYRANFVSKIDAEISKAKEEQQVAQNTYNGLVNDRNDSSAAMDQRIRSINSRIDTYTNGYNKSLDEALAFLSVLGTQKSGEIKEALQKLPTFSGSYSQYFNTNMAYGEWDAYAEYFKWLINDSYFVDNGTKEEKEIIKHAKKFVESKGYDANGFDDYMKDKLNNSEEAEDLFKLLSCLKTCHAYAITYKNNISKYENAVNKIPEANRVLNEKKQQVDALNGEKTGVVNSVTGCLQAFHTLCKNYQADVYYYSKYISAAKNTAGAEAKKISTHFSQLLAYLKELRDDLNEIDKQVEIVKKAIITYNENLDTWNDKKTSYESNNGSDGFSSQTTDDIAKARTEYDEKLYDTLDTFVVTMWNEFDDLYSKLTEKNNFVYGSKKIAEITTGQQLIDAVKGTSLSSVVTVEEADSKLDSLYKEATVEYVPYTWDQEKQLGFLSPEILPIQALRYLNSAYPDDSSLTPEEKTENSKTEAEYESAKSKLKGESTELDTKADEDPINSTGGNSELTEEENDNVTSDFGYTFKNNKITGTLPSKKTTTKDKTFTDEKYLLKEEGEGDDAKLDAGSGVSGQNDKTNSVLEGIGNIATTAVENLYILNYVFENFSYNTIVQDQIVKDNDLKNKTVVGQISEVKPLFEKEDIVSAAKEKTTTLSNFGINENNNHLYGGEIEYILFGNSSPSTNVTTAKASIYAIRFGFNCLFAFTDSQIRNTTMSAGLAVQAATMGIVPYQVVQIVLQLALAAAESAVDLSAMNHGLSVAIVKTKDTWSLSFSGAADALKDAANSAAQMAAEKLSGVVVGAVSSVTNGLNDLIDAKAEDLGQAITDLSGNMATAAEGVLESVADKVLTAIMTEIESGLNELQYVKVGTTTVGEIADQLPTKAEVRAKAVEIFGGVREKVPAIISDACGDNAMAQGIASRMQTQADELIGSMETRVLNVIDSAEDNVDITAYIADALSGLKRDLVEYASTYIRGISRTISDAAQNTISGFSEQLNGYIDKCGKELSAEAEKLIKEEIQEMTNGFVNTTLNLSGGNASPTDVKSSAVSMFKFGYKDYLMLLTYISICCGDSVLARTSDVIQLNIQNAGEGDEFAHKANTEKAKFEMSKAYTYVSVSATADLDMFFMDFSIFADQVADDGEDASEDGSAAEEKTGTSISYKGLLGY